MIRVKKDEITPTLKTLTAALSNKKRVLAVCNQAKRVIINRTSIEKLSANRQAFPAYSTKRYYAPVEKRPAGYPAPSGGRTKRVDTGRKLKTVAYDDGYGQYKAAMGFGSAPQLSVSNRMLSDIQVNIQTAWRGVLFFGSRLSAAKASGLHKGKFPFFNLHISEHENLYKILRSQLMLIKGMKA